MHDSGRGVLEPVRVVSTSEEVCRRLRQAIMDGDISTGTRLVERHLAEQLEVSRTPVREALKTLMAEGLVVADGHRGLIVARLSIENVVHAYVLRETLEGLAARLAAADQGSSLLERLSWITNRMEHPGIDAASIDSLHSEFHDTLAEMSGNPYLVQALGALKAFRTRMVSLGWVATQRVSTSVPEHRKILEAIEMHDADLAERMARDHVRRTREGLVRRLQAEWAPSND